MSPFSRFSRRRSLRFALFGVAVVLSTATASTQAQTPPFNVAEYAEYNEKTDDAAASFADRVARRSAVATVSNGERSTARSVQYASAPRFTSNAPVSTRRSAGPSTRSNVRPTDATRSRSKSQAAQTWEAFLFGTPNRGVSTPKFAFAPREADSPTARPLQSAQPTQPLQTAQTISSNQPLQPARPIQSGFDASTVETPTDAEIAAARRRRLQELNALLATRRPEEFARRLALADVENVENADSFVADAPALPILLAEPNAERQGAVFQDRAEFVRDDAPFDVARANRSKIRQASNLEPTRPLELADDGFAAFLLPTRPNALRLSPNVFLSTDLVPLPSAAPLREIAETPQPAETSQTSSSTRPTQNAQSPQTSQTSPSPFDVRPAQPLPNASTPATVATPLPAATSTDVPTLRPTAQFVEPRFLPSRR